MDELHLKYGDGTVGITIRKARDRKLIQVGGTMHNLMAGFGGGRIFQDPMKGTAPDMAIAENLALAFNRRSRSPLRRSIRLRPRRSWRSRCGSWPASGSPR